MLMLCINYDQIWENGLLFFFFFFFYNKSLTPLEIDNNKYADVSTVFLQSSSGQKKKKKKKKQNNLKNENSEKCSPITTIGSSRHYAATL